MRPKLIYLARRHPALIPAAFLARWRQHGALGMSLPRWKNVWRYTHNDVLHGLPGSAGHDGVGMVWHRSPEARRAHREDRSSQGAMERDERETFDELIVRSCALYEEDVVLAPPAAVRTKLIRFLNADHGTSIDVDVPLRGLVRNRRLPAEADAWGLEYDLIEELWFDDIGAAEAAAKRTPAMNLVVEETVLYRLDAA